MKSYRYTEADIATLKARGVPAERPISQPATNRRTDPVARAAPQKKPRAHEEDDTQMAFVERCCHYESKFPKLRLAFVVPNGGSRAAREDKQGRRYSPEAARLVKLGSRSGVPDWLLPCRSAGEHYIGLGIEFKSRIGRLSDEQKGYITLLEAAGWAVFVSRDVEHAWSIVLWYLTDGRLGTMPEGQ